MPDTNPGGDLIARLNLAGSLMPEVHDLHAFLEGCGREETIGPLLYPDVHRRGQKRLRALAKLAKAGARLRLAWEELQEAAAEEADPELDRAAQTMLAGFHRRARKAMEADHG